MATKYPDNATSSTSPGSSLNVCSKIQTDAAL
ncbi:hypothetical protein ES708_18033 [subsurface metagenome]